MKKIIYLLGKPGSGKGTLANQLSIEYNIPIISSNMYSEYIELKLPNYEVIEDLVKTGKHIPNHIVIDIIKGKIETPEYQNGFIIDGFPYNYEQALLAKELLVDDKLTALIYLKVEDKVVIDRLLKRKVCPTCKKSINEEICHECKVKTIIRSDDNIEVINKRLNLFHNDLNLILENFKTEKILTIDANQTVKQIFEKVINKIKSS